DCYTTDPSAYGADGSGGAGPSAGKGAGIANSKDKESLLNIINTIITNNYINKADGTQKQNDCYGNFDSEGSNIVMDTTNSYGWISSDKIGVNPHLDSLNDNGGPTPTLAIPGKSNPANGTAALTNATLDIPEYDQRQIKRQNPPAGYDIGAYELVSTTITFTINDAVNNPLENASIHINDTSITTNQNGEGIIAFEDYNTSIQNYTINKNGFADTSSSIDLSNGDTTLNIVLTDTSKPSFTVHDTSVYLNHTGKVNIPEESIISNISDNVQVDTLYLSRNDFGCNDAGKTITTDAIAKDQNGNTTQKEVTITIKDTIIPELSTTDITLPLDSNGVGAITASQLITNADDNCLASLDTALSGKTTYSCSDIDSSYAINIKVTDNVDSSVTKVAHVAIEDTISPKFVSNDLTIYLDSNGHSSIEKNNVVHNVNDNCGIKDTTISQNDFSCMDTGNFTINVGITDQSGNSTEKTTTLEIKDTIEPQLNVKDTSVILDENGIASIKPSDVIIHTSDNCGIVDTTISKPNFSCMDTGTVSVSINITDKTGNTTSRDINVRVKDTIKPGLNVENTSVTLDESGKASVKPSDIIMNAADNCTITDTTISQTNFTCVDKGNVDVEITVSDASGNYNTRIATVTVREDISPQLTVKNTTVTLGSNGEASITPSDLIENLSDNCSISDTLISQSNFNDDDVGDNPVDITVIDVNNNSAKKTAVVTVSELVGFNNKVSRNANSIYPNPFKTETHIEYSIKTKSYVNISIYSLTGVKIEELVNKNQSPGTYKAEFATESSGIYIVKIKIDGAEINRKIIKQ
uniref:T9SS type A sorting domain-containing protein n=1 Tax=Methanohalobium sp. TaxID=2837493 RepID=UPI0025CB92C3